MTHEKKNVSVDTYAASLTVTHQHDLMALRTIVRIKIDDAPMAYNRIATESVLTNTQIADLGNLLQEHEDILNEKSANLMSLEQRVNHLQAADDHSSLLESMRSKLFWLLEKLKDTVEQSNLSQETYDNPSNNVVRPYEATTYTKPQQKKTVPQEAAIELKKSVESQKMHLNGLDSRFNEILDATLDLTTNIPVDSKNATNINQLLALLGKCIDAFKE